MLQVPFANTFGPFPERFKELNFNQLFAQTLNTFLLPQFCGHKTLNSENTRGMGEKRESKK